MFCREWSLWVILVSTVWQLISWAASVISASMSCKTFDVEISGILGIPQDSLELLWTVDVSLSFLDILISTRRNLFLVLCHSMKILDKLFNLLKEDTLESQHLRRKEDISFLCPCGRHLYYVASKLRIPIILHLSNCIKLGSWSQRRRIR